MTVFSVYFRNIWDIFGVFLKSLISFTEIRAIEDDIENTLQNTCSRAVEDDIENTLQKNRETHAVEP